MIFNEQKYHKANKLKNVECFKYILDNDSDFLRSSFAIENDQAISLPKAPYCGIESSNTNIVKLKEVIQMIENQLYDMRCKKIWIKQAPALLSSTSEVLHKILADHAKSVEYEINHFIKLDQFETRIHSMQKRKIKKCVGASLCFNIEPVTNTNEVYEFITKCRLQQGLEVNISKEHFIDLIEDLPQDYRMYTVRDSSNAILACTVTLKITDQITYNYLPAFDRTYKALSPLVFLHYKLCVQLIRDGFSVLDLGVSSVGGVPQESLIEFKEKMGGIRQNRYSYLFEVQN